MSKREQWRGMGMSSAAFGLKLWRRQESRKKAEGLDQGPFSRHRIFWSRRRAESGITESFSDLNRDVQLSFGRDTKGRHLHPPYNGKRPRLTQELGDRTSLSTKPSCRNEIPRGIGSNTTGKLQKRALENNFWYVNPSSLSSPLSSNHEISFKLHRRTPFS